MVEDASDTKLSLTPTRSHTYPLTTQAYTKCKVSTRRVTAPTGRQAGRQARSDSLSSEDQNQ